MRTSTLAFLVTLMFYPSPGRMGQSANENPKIVSLCRVHTDSKAYDSKRVQFRSEISSEFADFSVFDPICPSNDGIGVWLMFGGDVDCPTPPTVNDVGRPKGKDMEFHGVSYSLIKDESFRVFHKAVTTRKIKRSSYRLITTLEGTFFSGDAGKDGRGRALLPGYGHLGCCHLFIIHQISQVDAQEL
jgi:hypothetical protein